MDQYKPTTSGKVPFRTWETFYEIYGPLPTPSSPSGSVPLVLLHGGPGIPGRYLLPLTSLAQTHGIPVILYDQLGCGASTRLPEEGADFWTVPLFLSELENLLEKLGVAEYALLGHSWGAMLAAEHALLHPPGLRKIILSNGAASMKTFEESAAELIKTLPADAQAAIEKYERLGEFDALEYKQATEVFYRTYVCRMDPWPVEVLESFRLFEEDTTVYLTMLGASEFTIFGTLKPWDILPRLGEIKTPTLVLNGKYDETSDAVVKPLVDHIEGSKWVQFEKSAHMPFLEERERYAQVVGDWLME